MIHVSICSNDDNGLFTGRVTRIDFDEYELTVEDNLWPPRGVSVAFRKSPVKQLRGDHQVRFGRDSWRESTGLGGYGGNIFWRVMAMPAVEAFGLMNYLMKLKYWHASQGECYLFDQFNAKKPIVAKEYFAQQAG